MVRKDCPKCGNSSYSSVEDGFWKCPSCRADLTNEPIKPAADNVKERLIKCCGRSGKKYLSDAVIGGVRAILIMGLKDQEVVQMIGDMLVAQTEVEKMDLPWEVR